MIKECLECGKTFKTDDKRRIYCNVKCYNKKKKRYPSSTAFKKGQKPWNKGKKGLHFSPGTEFKKGQRSLRWLPVGTKTIRTDKNKKKRRWIKVEEPNVWIEYAKFIWIKNNGEIPKNYLIHHLDKNSLNDNIENLCCLTRKAHINIHRGDLRKNKTTQK